MRPALFVLAPRRRRLCRPRPPIAGIRSELREFHPDLSDLTERVTRFEVHVGVPVENL